MGVNESCACDMFALATDQDSPATVCLSFTSAPCKKKQTLQDALVISSELSILFNFLCYNYYNLSNRVIIIGKNDGIGGGGVGREENVAKIDEPNIYI